MFKKTSPTGCFRVCENEEDGSVGIVSLKNQIIYISGYITTNMAIEFFKILSSFSHPNPKYIKPVLVIINSSGGDFNAGFAICDAIRAHHGVVNSLAMGFCCSAATLISSVCAERYSFPSTFFFIHEVLVSDVADCSYEQTKESTRAHCLMLDKMVKIYAQTTGCSERIIRRDLSNNKWFDADEALNYGSKGLIDNIIMELPPEFRMFVDAKEQDTED